jgi:hypothetical protein
MEDELEAQLIFFWCTMSVAQVSLRGAVMAERQKTERPSSPVLSLISLVFFLFFNTFSLFF